MGWGETVDQCQVDVHCAIRPHPSPLIKAVVLIRVNKVDTVPCSFLFCAESTAVKLKSKQEEIFEVEKDVACRSVTVKNMVDDTGLDTPVPLPMVDSKILIKVGWPLLHTVACS